MTVYVDDMRAKFGRMVMCHMIADTDAELHAMADAIGVARRWHQRPPKVSHSHYDISLSMRAKAVGLGAVEVTLRQLAMMVMVRRYANPNTPLLKPDEAQAKLRKLTDRNEQIIQGLDKGT